MAVQQNPDLEAGKGRKTIIADQCHQRLVEDQHERCVFLCVRRGRWYLAVDIPIIDDDGGGLLGLERLRRESGGWWKKYSLYSAIAVQEVKMRLMKVEESTSRQLRVQVCIQSIKYDKDISQLDEAIELEMAAVMEPCDCRVNINEELNEKYHCQNTVNNDLERYCRIERMREYARQQSDYQWLPEMLKYYWQNGIDQKAVAFLSGVGFVHSYKDLQYDTYMNAVSPYGRTIYAFLLVEGWHIRCLLILVGAGLSGSGCLIAIVAAFSQSIEVALTAGSYACGLSGVIIAVFTFLSAVI